RSRSPHGPVRQVKELDFTNPQNIRGSAGFTLSHVRRLPLVATVPPPLARCQKDNTNQVARLDMLSHRSTATNRFVIRMGADHENATHDGLRAYNPQLHR